MAFAQVTALPGGDEAVNFGNGFGVKDGHGGFAVATRVGCGSGQTTASNTTSTSADADESSTDEPTQDQDDVEAAEDAVTQPLANPDESVIEALKAADAEDIIVICGGVIPQQDYDFLQKAGVKAIFGPGTNIPAAARDILKLIREARS